MCGRFTLFSMPETLVDAFGAGSFGAAAPRYNIAPGQPIAVVRAAAGGGREFAMLRWGLVPSWAKDPSIGSRMINARAETVREKPAFRTAFRHRRCLVPADGFYEWQRPEGGKMGRKRPFYFRMRDGRPFAIAGLWERWQAPDGSLLESCALLTTGASAIVAPVHDRMPVILPPAAFPTWLAGAAPEAALLELISQTVPAEAMAAHPVGMAVNNPLFDDPHCIDPAA